jgi:DNA repair exonuclease SbcCD ATPase subunit
MSVLKMNKVFIPLIERLLKVDNYDKMKVVLDIGFSGMKMVDKYCENQHTNIVLDKEIDKYKDEIQNLEEKMMKIRGEKHEIERKMYEDMSKLRKELENKYCAEINDKNTRISTLNSDIFRIKNESVEKMLRINEEIKTEFIDELYSLKEDKNKEIEYLKSILEDSRIKYEETMKSELERVNRENSKIVEELKKKNEHYREKYEKLELKSVKKGIPYEDAILGEFEEYFEKTQNIFKIERCSNRAGKGDFLITNNYSGIRIMLEAKNMPSVSSSVKDQLPKFYKDIKDKTNQYDGAIMVAMGRIETKKNYEMEVLDENKVVSFVENYTLNMIERVNVILEIVHQKIQELKSQEELSKRQILENQVEVYKEAKDSYKKMKVVCDNQYSLMMKLKTNILNIFKIDVEEYILDKKTSEKGIHENIIDKIADFIKDEIERNTNISQRDLSNSVSKEFKEYVEMYKTDKKNGISKAKITKMVKAGLSGGIEMEINLSGSI